MCGIIAGFNTTIKKDRKIIKEAKNINKFIIEQYEDQYNRGQKGFGIIRINKKNDIELDRACEPIKFMLDLYSKPSEMIIAHHRQPTSTDNTMDQTHPIFISNKDLKFDYYVIHNGIISNDKDLYEKHEKLGFKYTTEYQETYGHYHSTVNTKFNDSESIAIELALFIEKKQNIVEIDNGAAFIVLQVDKETKKGTKVFFGRNGTTSDLNMCKTRGELRISSTGKGDEVKANMLYEFNLGDANMKLTSQEIKFEKKKEEKKEETTQTKLPINVDLKNEENNKNDAKTSNVGVTTLRTWVDLELLDYENWEDKPEELEKTYQDDLITTAKFQLKDTDSDEMARETEEMIDTEIEKAVEIMNTYKNIGMTQKIHIEDTSYFIRQLATIMNGIRKLMDECEDMYDEKKKTEKDKEEAYNNTGYIAKRHDHGRGFSKVHREAIPEDGYPGDF